MTVIVENEGPVTIVTMNRSETRNAVDRETAQELALQLAAFPQTCMRGDRMSAIQQFDMDFGDAMANEFKHGLVALSEEAVAGATRFLKGAGRHGE